MGKKKKKAKKRKFQLKVAMKGGGRKNLKRAIEEDNFTLEQGQSIMQVVDLRGSNLIQV